MAKEMYFGKNVSLKQKNFSIVAGYMNRTKKNFSATLNIIIEQWDEFSILVQKMREKQRNKEIQDLKKETDVHLNDLKDAKVVK